MIRLTENRITWKVHVYALTFDNPKESLCGRTILSERDQRTYKGDVSEVTCKHCKKVMRIIDEN